MDEGGREDDTWSEHMSARLGITSFGGNEPVPKCFPMKKRIGGMRKYDTRLDRVGKNEASGRQLRFGQAHARRSLTKQRHGKDDQHGHNR
jgi:hypothetical protein